MARILDGKHLAQTIHAEIAAGVSRFMGQHGLKTVLAAVLVGDNAASQVYVRNKRRACDAVGIESRLHALSADTTQADLLELIKQLNGDPRVSGILVQLPLPKQIEESAIIAAVSALKDVDGFGPENLGLLLAGQPRFAPCTPLGVQQILVRNDIDTDGKHVVIVGRSNIVGKPLAVMLMQKGSGANATATLCH